MGEIIDVNGPIVTVRLGGVRNGDQVKIGRIGLVGEVIGLDGDRAVVQVYESTEGARPGEAAESLGHPLSVELGPGLMGNIFDGVQRPLPEILKISGDQIGRGIQVPSLNRETSWRFEADSSLSMGDRLTGGAVTGTVQETETIKHHVLVPPHISGEIVEHGASGEYAVDAVIARVKSDDGRVHDLRLFHRWPVRTPRPYSGRNHAAVPLITGQRVLDTFFPILKGGKGAVPGPFGAGKTMVQQQIARWANADIVIYVGCGERGNELVDILETFPELTDPHTGRSLMERTLLVANTSNMPVVAREASIYVGVTIAEYYRDQGYDVVMVADSTSRWAEALREVSGRLGQMPVEEGYPAYLASRLSAFYERAGRVETLRGNLGSVTLIGAVSPPGGDFSEPVTSHTKEIVPTFWALSKELADARHYPAVDWLDSFSGYVDTAAHWWSREVDPTWAARRAQALAVLSQADDLSRIVNLVGPEALSPTQRWVLEGAALLKEGVLQQSAIDEVDSYASPRKQFLLLDIALCIYDEGHKLIELGVPVEQISRLSSMAQFRRLKSVYTSEQADDIDAFNRQVKKDIDELRVEYGAPREAEA